MNYIEFKEKLIELKEEKYREFASKLGETQIPLLGIRIPLLKKLVRSVFLTCLDVLEFDVNSSVEEQLCFFMIYFERNKDYQKQFEFLNKYSFNICCWQITDLVSSYMKKAPFNYFLENYKTFINSKDLFTRRFYIVYSIKYCFEEEVLVLLNLLPKDNEYYVIVAISWFLATLAVKFENDVYNYLINNLDNKLLVRKTISKIVESFRIEKDIKEKFKKIRGMI